MGRGRGDAAARGAADGGAALPGRQTREGRGRRRLRFRNCVSAIAADDSLGIGRHGGNAAFESYHRA